MCNDTSLPNHVMLDLHIRSRYKNIYFKNNFVNLLNYKSDVPINILYHEAASCFSGMGRHASMSKHLINIFLKDYIVEDNRGICNVATIIFHQQTLY